MTDHANIVREYLIHNPPYAESDDHSALAALDALVAERDEWEVAAKKISGARNRWKKRAEAAEADRDEARRLLTLMRKRKGDFELPNYWKGEIDAALGKEGGWLVNDDEMEAQMEYWKSKAKAAEAERDRLKAKWENAAYDARSWERNCMDEINRAEDLQSEVARLAKALQALENATRILDVMLREPAAKGLMTAEDYRGYVNGAWLGVDEANVKARAALGEDA